jgi:hypothetical protein
METQTLLISHTVVDQELLQLNVTSKTLKSSSDKIKGQQSEKLQHSLEWGTMHSR